MDLFSFGQLDGSGNGQVSVTAVGQSFVDLRNSLSGDVQMSLNQGALTGIDLVSALKNLPAELKELNAPARLNQKTTFSALSASFHLEQGVGRNQDLKLASQLVNVNGGGKIDLKQNIIDYNMDVAANPREFSSLKGVNIPLKITGPINAPIYALDFNALVKGKKTETEKQQALKQELKKQITTILP
jgi:AsmA protein